MNPNMPSSGRDVGDIDYIGPPSPFPTEREAWMAKYVARMVERGIAPEDAWACCRACADDHEYDSDPRNAADDEMSYWDDDGDGLAALTEPQS